MTATLMPEAPPYGVQSTSFDLQESMPSLGKHVDIKQLVVTV